MCLRSSLGKLLVSLLVKPIELSVPAFIIVASD